MSPQLITEIAYATGETGYLVLVSTLLAVFIGLPLGTFLYISKTLTPKPRLTFCLSGLINTMRSIPFVILLIALIPVTRFLVGTSIGIHAAIVPLSIAASVYFARLIDNIYQELPVGLIEAGQAMGATHLQFIRHMVIPECLPALIQAITLTSITLINYSAMAGIVGAGGLGDFAIRYGYQRFNLQIMLITLIILIALVQGLQYLGDRLAKRLTH